MSDTIKARFVAETELLGLELLPGQEEALTVLAFLGSIRPRLQDGDPARRV